MNWVKNRWIDALLKYVAIYAVFHIMFIFIGIVVGGSASVVGINLLWAHFSKVTLFNYFISILFGVILYFLVFFTLSRQAEDY